MSLAFQSLAARDFVDCGHKASNEAQSVSTALIGVASGAESEIGKGLHQAGHLEAPVDSDEFFTGVNSIQTHLPQIIGEVAKGRFKGGLGNSAAYAAYTTTMVQLDGLRPPTGEVLFEMLDEASATDQSPLHLEVGYNGLVTLRKIAERVSDGRIPDFQRAREFRTLAMTAHNPELVKPGPSEVRLNFVRAGAIYGFDPELANLYCFMFTGSVEEVEHALFATSRGLKDLEQKRFSAADEPQIVTWLRFYGQAINSLITGMNTNLEYSDQSGVPMNHLDSKSRLSSPSIPATAGSLTLLEIARALSSAVNKL